MPRTSTLKMGGARSSESLLSNHDTTRRNKPEVHDLCTGSIWVSCNVQVTLHFCRWNKLSNKFSVGFVNKFHQNPLKSIWDLRIWGNFTQPS